jgi:hypothetical protein
MNKFKGRRRLMAHEYELKTDPEVFQASVDGKKPWEVRFDDRGYEVGDFLHLRETKYSGDDMKDGKPLVYTGRDMVRRVDYVLHGHPAGYGIQDGFCIMSVS